MSHTCAGNLSRFSDSRDRSSLPVRPVCPGRKGRIRLRAIRSGKAEIMITGGAEEMHFLHAAVFDLMLATSSRYNDALPELRDPLMRNGTVWWWRKAPEPWCWRNMNTRSGGEPRSSLRWKASGQRERRAPHGFGCSLHRTVHTPCPWDAQRNPEDIQYVKPMPRRPQRGRSRGGAIHRFTALKSL